jgi:hypothetical protein
MFKDNLFVKKTSHLRVKIFDAWNLRHWNRDISFAGVFEHKQSVLVDVKGDLNSIAYNAYSNGVIGFIVIEKFDFSILIEYSLASADVKRLPDLVPDTVALVLEIVEVWQR